MGRSICCRSISRRSAVTTPCRSAKASCGSDWRSSSSSRSDGLCVGADALWDGLSAAGLSHADPRLRRLADRRRHHVARTGAALHLPDLMGFVLGLTLYGTVYLLPVYLAQIRGYDALQIGEVIMWLGLPQLFIFPIIPAVMRRVDPRLMVAFGLVLFAASCFMNAHLTHEWGIEELRWSQLVRAVGQPFIMVPLSGLSAGSLPDRDQAQGSAIFNIMRNLGGSVGIAMLATYLTVREHFHFSVIAERLTQNSPRTAQAIQEFSHIVAAKAPGSGEARMQAIAQLANQGRSGAFTRAA